ncbi:hypothetical protein, partial [Bradyrhizobium sp. 38]
PKLESQPSPDENPESQQTLDEVVSYRGYFPKITQMLISGPATNATSCGIITIGSGLRLIRSKQESSSHLHMLSEKRRVSTDDR